MTATDGHHLPADTSAAAVEANEAAASPRPPEIAFVIPAFNEESLIAGTLASIHRELDGRWRYEIVVVDNGSTDRTVEIARAHGARAYVRPLITVAGLRNFGARQCSAPILVFLDADVVLTESWGATIAATIAELLRCPRLLTGSWCGIPPEPSWIERSWFAPKQLGGNNHINSGHLIIGRDFFNGLGGFDAGLQTGEDYELCVRAVAADSIMCEDPRLAVVHYGYPRSLSAFVQREVWHGRSDFTSIASLIRSRVALATVLFLASHIALIVAILAGSTPVALAAVAAVVLVCAAASIRQYRTQPLSVVLSNTLIYYFYFAGRSIALLRAVSARSTFVPRDHR